MRKRVTGNDVYVDDNAIMYVTNSVHTIISTSTSACIASPLSSFLDAQPQSPETAVHLQIIKVLLTAVTTPTCEVHEMSLLKCLQACVNICTYSKNPVNQATARAVCEAADLRNDVFTCHRLSLSSAHNRTHTPLTGPHANASPYICSDGIERGSNRVTFARCSWGDCRRNCSRELRTRCWRSQLDG